MSVSSRRERAHFGILDVVFFFLFYKNVSRPDVRANLVSCLSTFRGFEVAGSILINKEITIGPSSPAAGSLTYGLVPKNMVFVTRVYYSDLN